MDTLPNYAATILRAHAALGVWAESDRTPAAWNLHFTQIAGDLARAARARAYVRTEAARLAAITLAALRCFYRDKWEFPDMGRPHMDQAHEDGAAEAAAAVAEGVLPTGGRLDVLLAGVVAEWGEFLSEVRHVMEQRETEPDPDDVDILVGYAQCAAASAFHLCRCAEEGRLEF